MYEGDADTYVRVYTLALRVDPMVFAPDISPLGDEMKALVAYGEERAAESGKTVLFPVRSPTFPMPQGCGTICRTSGWPLW